MLVWVVLMNPRRKLGLHAQALGTVLKRDAQADARGASQVLDRGGQAVARGSCLSQVLDCGAQVVVRGAVPCTSQVLDHGAEAVASGVIDRSGQAVARGSCCGLERKKMAVFFKVHAEFEARNRAPSFAL
jgi:hypothetical protein